MSVHKEKLYFPKETHGKRKNENVKFRIFSNHSNFSWLLYVLTVSKKRIADFFLLYFVAYEKDIKTNCTVFENWYIASGFSFCKVNRQRFAKILSCTKQRTISKKCRSEFKSAKYLL